MWELRALPRDGSARSPPCVSRAVRSFPQGGRGAGKTKRRKEGVLVKGFLERLQWKLAGMMQGRRGADTLSSFLMVVGIVLLLVSIVPGLDVLSWVALIALAYALFRS